MEILRTIPTSELLQGGGVALLALYVVLCIGTVAKKKSRGKKYLGYFEENRNDDLRKTLTLVRRNYRQNSKEYKAIENALHYMDYSISRDYENALEILNKCFAIKKVRKFHENYLKDIWKKNNWR